MDTNYKESGCRLIQPHNPKSVAYLDEGVEAGMALGQAEDIAQGHLQDMAKNDAVDAGMGNDEEVAVGFAVGLCDDLVKGRPAATLKVEVGG